MSKIAVVTGSSSGIGEAVALKLLELDFTVIGISRTRGDIEDKKFTHISCDLSKNIADKCASLKELDLSLLVNCAGFGVFKPHEELNEKLINSMININLTAPITLSNLFLRTLKKNSGTIINITSIEALRSSKFSALYSATKSGLRAFSHALFEEVRSSGVNVISINPDMTDTPFFDELHFKPSKNMQETLLASDIAKAIETVLLMRDGANITDLTIRSKKFGIIKNNKV